MVSEVMGVSEVMFLIKNQKMALFEHIFLFTYDQWEPR